MGIEIWLKIMQREGYKILRLKRYKLLWISAFIGGKDFKQSQSCNPELGLLAFISYFVLKGIHLFNNTFKTSHSFHQDNFKKFQEKKIQWHQKF